MSFWGAWVSKVWFFILRKVGHHASVKVSGSADCSGKPFAWAGSIY